MRGTVAISAAVHLAIIVGASVAFPNARPFEVEPMKPVPVDIVPASELTRLKAGKKEAPPQDKASAPDKPETPPKETAKVDEPTKTASLPPPPAPEPEAPKIAAPAPPAPRPEPRKSEPEPAPKEPEPKKAKPEEKKPEKVAAPVPVPPIRPAHVPRPAPPKKKQPDFDPDRIAALLDKSPDRAAARPQAEVNEPSSQGDPRGLDERMSLSEIDALRSQISRCWSPPVGVQGAADLAIQLKLALNPDGSLNRPPEIITRGSGVAYLAAADSARRAVLRCQPYDLPISKYNAWRDIKVNFDPREMLGG